ncbi:MAG: HlyD family efflux transporter periplasmic adaptor subunit [Betaproteobacteria bacterium]|jgi:protease secretion system membrane fusion protein|nr:HlyD family efflux transporter periplasmic adaptor subunit [Betaproteobacteria bacterium]
MDIVVRRGLWMILMLLVGAILWAAFIPLDAAVPSSGTVVVDGRRKVVQHPRGGVIQQVLIREGEPVAEGDILIRLDSSTELANRSQAHSQLAAARFQSEALRLQLEDLRDLTDEGFFPRNQLIELERKYNESLAQQQALRDQIFALTKELERTAIRAPISGRVMGVGINTPGAVVIAGAKLMEVVPNSDQVFIEAQVRPYLADKIVPGATAQIRFSALQAVRTPVIRGTVEWISADRFFNPEDRSNPEGYFLAKVTVAPSELLKVDGFRVIPGMPAEVMIKTGERTFFQYLMKPFIDRLAVSVREH